MSEEEKKVKCLYFDWVTFNFLYCGIFNSYLISLRKVIYLKKLQCHLCRRKRSQSVTEMMRFSCGENEPSKENVDKENQWNNPRGKENSPTVDRREERNSSGIKSQDVPKRKGKTPENAPSDGHEMLGQTEDEEEEEEIKEVLQTPDFNPFELPELKAIYPLPYGEKFKELHILDKTVEIFLSCLGVRGSLRMGATSFRNFTRWISRC